MIEMTVELLYGKLSLSAQLTAYSFCIFLLLKTTAVAVVDFLARDLLEAIAGQMKTSVAGVAI